MPRRFLAIAHRGFSGRYPENTLASFRAALEIGCTWLETDVRQTADGVTVLLHDATVDRTTDGSGRIDSLSREAVQRLDAGAWKSQQFRGERIPTLEELLALVAGRAQIVIELKSTVAAVDAVVHIVRSADAVGWTAASAFEWETILRVRQLAPAWRTTWLTPLREIGPAEAISRCVAAGVDTLGPHASRTDQALVEAAHRAGLVVRCWGLGDDRGPEMRRLIDIEVDGATTDHPDALLSVLRADG